jgi:hypothetical protein
MTVEMDLELLLELYGYGDDWSCGLVGFGSD